MASVILELQHDALNKDIRVTDLLRKSLVVARKLKLAEFQEWLEKELSGYDGPVPEYRKARGEIKGWNPYRGWIPLIFEDPKEGEAISKRANGQSIAEIEDLIGRADGSSTFHMPYPAAVQRELSKGFGFETQVSLFVPRSALIKTVEAVRNIVLNWALKLEEEGVLGEGLAFSPTEQAAAERSAQNINNFYGPVENPQIAQGGTGVIQVSANVRVDAAALQSFIGQLRQALPHLQLDTATKTELEAETATLEAQAASPKPKSTIIKESLRQ